MDGGRAYEELGELYDVWCADVVEDLPFYAGLAEALAEELGRAQLDVVELGAGSGRVTDVLATAGHHVTAVDASPGQLDRLRARTAHCAHPPATVLGDMRDVADLVPPATADLVVVPFRGLLHVTEDRDAVFLDIARVLRPGGVLAFDVFHPTPAQRRATGDRWIHRRAAPTATGRWRFDECVRYAADATGLDLTVEVRCRWSPKRGRPRHSGTDEPLADPVPGAATERRALLELRTVPHAEWGASLTAAGLELDGAYGWFDARPLGPDDDDSIWVARLPG